MDAYKRTERLFDWAKKLGLIQHSTGEGAPTVAMVAEMLMETESDFRMDLAFAALVEKETKDEYLRMEEALEEIAGSRMSGDMMCKELEFADFKEERDIMILSARAALPKKGES